MAFGPWRSNFNLAFRSFSFISFFSSWFINSASSFSNSSSFSLTAFAFLFPSSFSLLFNSLTFSFLILILSSVKAFSTKLSANSFWYFSKAFFNLFSISKSFSVADSLLLVSSQFFCKLVICC